MRPLWARTTVYHYRTRLGRYNPGFPGFGTRTHGRKVLPGPTFEEYSVSLVLSKTSQGPQMQGGARKVPTPGSSVIDLLLAHGDQWEILCTRGTMTTDLNFLQNAVFCAKLI